MLCIFHVVALVALVFNAPVVKADVDYSCATTSYNSHSTMCSTSMTNQYLPCQQECNQFTLVKDTANNGAFCITSAVQCGGSCASNSKFKLTTSSTPHDHADLDFSCCMPGGTENALVCGQCFGSNGIYYKDFVVKQINSCTCGNCPSHATISQDGEDALSNVFTQNTNLIVEEEVVNH